ncbi:hypothetical protein V8E51_006877 [Hyaloscypha variabilis]
MTGPESAGSRAHYVTAYTRVAEIQDLYGPNEVRALAELPLEKYASNFHLDDNSEIGRRILWLLEQSEHNRDVSLLEKAGELLMEQSARVPVHWRSPAVSAPPIGHGLSDEVYEYSSMSNDPFAKVGFVKVVESMPVTQHSLLPNEPQHTAYPDLLVNPAERWIRPSSNDPRPMKLIRPIPLSSSHSWLYQQVQRQLGTSATRNSQKLPQAPVKPNPMKATDPYRVRKLSASSKPKAQVTKTQTVLSIQKGGLPTPQGHPLPQLPITPTNPYFSVPKWQKDFPGSEAKAYSSQGQYYSNESQPPQAVPTRRAHATVNAVSTPTPSLAVYNQFPSPTKFQSSSQTPSRPVVNQQPYDPTAQPLPQPPAIRTPTTPLSSSSQRQMPRIIYTP